MYILKNKFFFFFIFSRYTPWATFSPVSLTNLRKYCKTVLFQGRAFWEAHDKNLQNIIKRCVIKGTVSRDFFFRFFSRIIFPQASENKLGNLGSFRIFSQNRRDIRKSRFTTCINDTGGEFATSYHWPWWHILPPVPLVLLTLVENFWISSKPKLGPLVHETVDLIPIVNKKISKLHYRCLGAGVYLKSSLLYCSDQF